MFTRHVSVTRKILLISIIVGLLSAIVAGGVQFLLEQQRREDRYEALISGIQNWFTASISDIRATAESLQSLTLNECRTARAELTSRAAFNLNVRTILLIKDQKAFCSSATGIMDVPLHDLAPDIDLNKSNDTTMIMGTPMMPGKPAIALWFRNPLINHRGVFVLLNINFTPYMLYGIRQFELSGIAIGTHNQAISTFSADPINLKTFPQLPLYRQQIEGTPLTLYLYGQKWRLEDIQFAILFGLMMGVLSALIAAYISYMHWRPGKEILAAIKHNQFYVVYQPVVNAAEMKVSGVEALMRWKHPTYGEIPPDVFIPFAENQQLIVPLTQHLFSMISRDANMLKTLLPQGAKLGINIAPAHLQAASFARDIKEFASTLPANYFSVVLEITERDMLRYTEVTKVFEWLHENGFEIAIDDFGTGHSALIYLERFTLDYLKIDRGFVNAIGTETVTSPVLDAVLTLAKRLDMLTVAEGVETREQVIWLRDRGVHYMQGYFFSRPLTLAQFLHWQLPPHDDLR